ncbi:MAG: hypothetical protein NTV09_11350 [Bacteroidetes bacterium]|nr:hypothetical protein [Bacteroidota bacterium]
MSLRIFIDPSLSSFREVRYVFQIISGNKNIDIAFVHDGSNSDFKITPGPESDFAVSSAFYEKIRHGKFNFEEHFINGCLIRDENGKEDLISTIFYCINSLQEYQSASDDGLGRFQYKNSYQYKYKNVLVNIVQELIDRICEHPRLKDISKRNRKSKIFLTHDIDSIHGSWKEDGFHALKKLQPGKFLSVMLNAAIGRPDWLNMDKVMKIEDENGFRSTFYWLLYKDKRNADYHFKSRSIQNQVAMIQKNGWENGLHKSLHSTSFREEIAELGVDTNGNRFHYLNFKLPEGYSVIEGSGLKLDTSLGFTEHWGFRNSYGLPFMPYCLAEARVHDFIEVPMQVMDRTFFTKRIPVSEIKKELIDWFEKNRYNAVFSINFHNNFFSELKYAGYAELYKSLLSYFRESGFEPTTQKELVNEFYRPEKFKLADNP